MVLPNLKDIKVDHRISNQSWMVDHTNIEWGFKRVGFLEWKS